MAIPAAATAAAVAPTRALAVEATFWQLIIVAKVETVAKLTILWANCDDVADFPLHLPHDCRCCWVGAAVGWGKRMRMRMWMRKWKLEHLPPARQCLSMYV